MSRLWIRGGRLVDPEHGVDEVADLVLADGRIAELRPGGGPSDDDEVLDAAGKVVAPGFVDLQVRLGEPGFEHRETIRTGLEAAAAGGFTAVACLADTDPVVDERAVVEHLLREAERHPFARLLPIAAASKGREGVELAEMGELAAAGAVAFSDAPRSLRDPAFLRRALRYARHFGLPLIERPEDGDLAGSGVVHEGPVSARLGLPGRPGIAEEIAVVRSLVIAEETGGRLHLSPVTTARSLDRIREARARGVEVTCGTTLHHVLLTDEEVVRRRFSPHTRVEPPLRSAADVDALRRGLADGTVDVLVSDHSPFEVTEKDVPFSDAPAGIVGLETLVPLALDRLVAGGALTLQRLIELLASGPRRVLGLGDGGLADGAPGDITLLDLDRAGTIDAGRFRSRSRNTPFHGEEHRGAPVGTVLAGRRVRLPERIGRS